MEMAELEADVGAGLSEKSRLPRWSTNPRRRISSCVIGLNTVELWVAIEMSLPQELSVAIELLYKVNY